MRTNWAIGTLTASGIAVALLWSGMPVLGNDVVPPAQNTHGALQEIDRKIEDLQRQKESLQRQAEQQEALADLQNQARARKEELAGELTKIGNAETTTSPAVKAQRQARLQHFETQSKAVADVLAVKDLAALPKVRDIFAQIADLDTEWEIVRDPQHQTAVMLEELETQATSKDGTEAQRKLLDRIRALCKENTAARDVQLQTAKAIASKAREIEKLVEQFYSGN